MAASISELDSFRSRISWFSCLISSSFSSTAQRESLVAALSLTPRPASGGVAEVCSLDGTGAPFQAEAPGLLSELFGKGLTSHIPCREGWSGALAVPVLCLLALGHRH